MQDTAGEVGMISSVMYSWGPLHMAEQKQGDQLEHAYSSSVRIRSVALRTCQMQWTIGRGGERGTGISVLIARKDDDDDSPSGYRLMVGQTGLFKLGTATSLGEDTLI